MTVLLVLATILLFLGAGWAFRRGRTMPPVPERAPRVRMPSGVFFARSHTWINLFPTGRAWLGIDDFVSRLLDRPTVRFLVEPGAHVLRGEPILSLEENGHALTVRSPIDGCVLGVNPALRDRLEWLSRAPLTDGWAFELEPDRCSDVKNLLLGEQTHAWMREEFARLRDVFAGAGGVEPALLQDGGPPVAGAMRHMGADLWRRFDREFLAAT